VAGEIGIDRFPHAAERRGEMMDDKEREELENPESWDWERAESRPGRKKPRAVVSVAFNRDDFETVAAFAERAGMKLSEFIRSAAIGCAEGKMLVVFLTSGSPDAGGGGLLSLPAVTQMNTKVDSFKKSEEPSYTRA
jgi:hypothetical protein